MQREKILKRYPKGVLMSFPRLAAIIVIVGLLQAAVAQATETATCTFDTFTAPTGYSLTVVNGITDDGTVVGQLLDTSTGQYLAFTYSASGVFTKYTAPASLM